MKTDELNELNREAGETQYPTPRTLISIKSYNACVERGADMDNYIGFELSDAHWNVAPILDMKRIIFNKELTPEEIKLFT